MCFLTFFFFAASHLLFQRNSGSLWNKERYWGQLQTDETVSSSRRRLQAWTSAGCSLHQLVSSRPGSKLAEMMTNAAAVSWQPLCCSLCRILEITQSLTSVVLSLPEELMEDLQPTVTFVSQFLSWHSSVLHKISAVKWTYDVMTVNWCHTSLFSFLGLDGWNYFLIYLFFNYHPPECRTCLSIWWLACLECWIPPCTTVTTTHIIFFLSFLFYIKWNNKMKYNKEIFVFLVMALRFIIAVDL